MSINVESLVRENILGLTPYSSARAEFMEAARIFLDANENSFGSPLGRDYLRYPDPLQTELKRRVAELHEISPSRIFVGNGSDEAIDLLFRVFCRPQIDTVIVCPPTYGMYEVAAGINDVAVCKVNLTAEFQLDVDAVEKAVGDNTKLLFICSPNNPTGNLLDREAILEFARRVPGIVVVDEAYIHFSDGRSLVAEVDRFPNLVVLQTFSKAWGLAGLRLGLAFADARIIRLLNRVKPPYNVGQFAQETALQAIEKSDQLKETVCEIVRERRKMASRFAGFGFVKTVYPSDANFLLVRTTNARELYGFLVEKGIVVRDRSKIILCEGCLRITVGMPDDNRMLLNAMNEYEESFVS